ncbi:MAG TPA: hypothetical protein VGN95_07665 [Pyrinomonadaceae bacterium]|jgi:hypothetical protein|nr:hypothetical protein [Pyrinomonadaceae bacterium]
MNKKFFAAALSLLSLISINALRANAQSCPNQESYGFRQTLAVNKTLQSQIEVTYFTTDDPNVFLSEKAGIKRSATYANLNTEQFVAKIDSLEKAGLASIKKQQSATSYLGEVAELNLERNLVNNNAKMINAGFASPNSNDVNGLDRKTEINVYEGLLSDRDSYRVSLLSSFVDAKANGGQSIVDYDAIVLLKPGQTAVFKLSSNYEVKRSGAARSYIAVTMRSVNSVGLASLGRRY